MRTALAEYGRVIKADGWKAGEKLITEYEKKFTDFRKWAYALGISLRAKEILDQKKDTKNAVRKH
jgi:hypothetical protein